MMENLPYLFAVGVALTTLLASLVIWARRRLWIRAGAVAALAVLLGLDYLALNDLLSRPKPVELELGAGVVEEAQVIAAVLAENKAIYLWLRLPDVSEPRYYRMRWQRDTALQLREAIQKAEREHGAVAIRLPFEPSLEERIAPRFYALPRASLPRKPTPDLIDYAHPSLQVRRAGGGAAG